MKRIERKSPFWSRLLGLLITFVIIAVLVFGGVKNLTSELSAAHEALAASQYELGKTRNALDNTRAQLTAVENALASASAEVDRMGRKLEASQQQLEAAGGKIIVLNHANDQLKQRWGYSLQALAQRNERVAYLDAQLMRRNGQLAETDLELRRTQVELDRLRNQPQWSVIVTSERQMQTAYRERFAMSQARMLVEGDGGFMYYEGMAAQHEVEQYASYAERTQVILTTTAPGHDVLKCLNDASLGCGAVVAAQAQAVQMQAYSYESRFRSEEMLLIGARG